MFFPLSQRELQSFLGDSYLPNTYQKNDNEETAVGLDVTCPSLGNFILGKYHWTDEGSHIHWPPGLSEDLGMSYLFWQWKRPENKAIAAAVIIILIL